MKDNEKELIVKGEQAKKIMEEIKKPATDKQKNTLIHALQNRVPRVNRRK